MRAALHQKLQIHLWNYTARAWALNLNISVPRENWTEILLQKIIQLSRISKFNQGITGCYKWLQWGQHIFFSLAKCQHSQGCISGNTSHQHVMGWSYIWLPLNGFRSRMGSLPGAGSRWVYYGTHWCSEEQTSACRGIPCNSHIPQENIISKYLLEKINSLGIQWHQLLANSCLRKVGQATKTMKKNTITHLSKHFYHF